MQSEWPTKRELVIKKRTNTAIAFEPNRQSYLLIIFLDSLRRAAAISHEAEQPEAVSFGAGDGGGRGEHGRAQLVVEPLINGPCANVRLLVHVK